MPDPRLTRKDIRRSIGYDLAGAFRSGMVIGHATEFSFTTITDPGIIGDTNEGTGRYVVIPDSRDDADSHVAVVTAFDPTTNLLTFTPEHPSPPESGEYELWDEQYDPRRINGLINQAIADAEASGVLCPETLDLAYLPPYTARIKAPDGWIAVVRVEMADKYQFYGYLDIRAELEEDDDSESDDEFYPFHTVKLSGSHSFTLENRTNLGIYDSIGWEVSGHFDTKLAAEGRGRELEIREWGFVRQDFDPHNLTEDSDGNPVISYAAGNFSYVLDAYLYREAEVKWYPTAFIIWTNSGEIELEVSPYANYGYRLRLHGAKRLTLMDNDADVPEVPASYIRFQSLVSLLRGLPVIIPEGTQVRDIRREWEVRAQREYDQLPRLQQSKYLV